VANGPSEPARPPPSPSGPTTASSTIEASSKKLSENSAHVFAPPSYRLEGDCVVVEGSKGELRFTYSELCKTFVPDLAAMLGYPPEAHKLLFMWKLEVEVKLQELLKASGKLPPSSGDLKLPAKRERRVKEPLWSASVSELTVKVEEGGKPSEYVVAVEVYGEREGEFKVLEGGDVKEAVRWVREQALKLVPFGEEESERFSTVLEELRVLLSALAGGRFAVKGEGGLFLADTGVWRRARAAMFYVREGEAEWLGELTYAAGWEVKEGKRGPRKRFTVKPLLFVARAERGFVVELECKVPEGPVFQLDGSKLLLNFKSVLGEPQESFMPVSVAERYKRGERRSIAEVYPRLLSRVKRFVNLDFDPRLYHVFACYAVATYFAAVFPAFPQLIITASYGSGKTRAGKTVTCASHRGYVVTDPTEASVFRLAEGVGATMYVDDEAGEGGRLLHLTYKKGLNVSRVEKGSDGRFYINLYETYCPLIVAVRDLPSEVQVARAIVVTLERASDPNPEGGDPEFSDFADLREELYLAELSEFPRVARVYRELARKRSALGLEGRDFEVWGPILAIAKLAGKLAFMAAYSYALENVERKRESMYIEEKEVLAGLERLLLARLEELVKGGLESFWRGEAELPESERERLAEAAAELEKGVLFTLSDLLRAMREVLAREEGEDAPEKPYTKAHFEHKWTLNKLTWVVTGRFESVIPREKRTARLRLRRLTLSSFLKAAERYSYPVDERLLKLREAVGEVGSLSQNDAMTRGENQPRHARHSKQAVGGPKAEGSVTVIDTCVEPLSQNDAMTRLEGGIGGVEEGGLLQRGNVTERILEFVGKEGKPLFELYRFVTRDLKLLNPDSLLRSLFEKGVLVKVPREDSSLWVTLGSL